MGGIFPESREDEILRFLRQDQPKQLEEYIKDNQLQPDLLFTKHKRTLLQLSCYFESPRCLAKLVEMNYDYNQTEFKTGDTPLFICSKFNNLEMVKILLSKSDCKKLIKNCDNLNEFDIAFLKGNYNICYYLLYEYDRKNKIFEDNTKNVAINEDEKYENSIYNKSKKKFIISTRSNIPIKEKKLDKDNYDINQIYQKYFYNTNFEYDTFLTLQAENKYPLFNMPLFFKCLCSKTLPSKCPSFAPERKKTKELETKIPDPNESWGHFFKRVAKMELYNPPMVDKKNVSIMNSMYMNAQMKLLENEYGVKMGYYDRQNENDETKHVLDQSESEILSIKQNTEQNTKKKSNGMNSKKTESDDSDKEQDKDKEEDDKEIEDLDNINNEINFKNEINDINNDDNEENISVMKINENSSERKIKEENKIESN